MHKGYKLGKREFKNKPFELSKSVIEIARKHIEGSKAEIRYSDYYVNYDYQRRCKSKPKVIIIQRVIKFDQDLKQFYILYQGNKFFVRPGDTELILNKHDMSLYNWTLIKNDDWKNYN